METNTPPMGGGAILVAANAAGVKSSSELCGRKRYPDMSWRNGLALWRHRWPKSWRCNSHEQPCILAVAPVGPVKPEPSSAERTPGALTGLLVNRLLAPSLGHVVTLKSKRLPNLTCPRPKS